MSSAAVLCFAMKMPFIETADIRDTITTRGILLAMHFGLVYVWKRCPKCKNTIKLRIVPRDDCAGVRAVWMCPFGGHKGDHLREIVASKGPLAEISAAYWAAFLSHGGFMELSRHLRYLCRCF